MTTATAVRTPSGAQAVAKRWSTPAMLWLALASIWAAAALPLLVAEVNISRVHTAFQTVGVDATPSILAALDMRASLADMDADAANYLLGCPDGIASARDAFEGRRQTVSQRLVDAAQNITYGDAERTPILTLQQNIGTYLQLVSQAETLHRSDPAASLTAYRQATDLMHTTILPAASALDAVNSDHLQTRCLQEKAEAPRLLALFIAVGVLTIAVLLATQLFPLRRTRRLLNLPLLAATLVSIAFVVWVSGTLVSEAGTLKGAKEDAFDSVHALWGARAVAYDANADESLYLLGPQRTAQYDAAFKAQSALLVAAPVTPQLVAGASGDRATFKGYLGDELRNITFPGEQQPALDTLSTYGQYLAVDAQIRTLETSGQHQAAVNLDTGTAVGQSDWAFGQFDQALGRTLGINQHYFDFYISQGFADLRSFTYLGPVVMLLVAGLAWLGLRPRLNEYRT